jgi:hypothetical protein
MRSLEPAIPVGLADVIDRALRVDKKERWPNARAMLAALSSLELPASKLVLSTSARGEIDVPTASSSLTSWSRPDAWLRRAAAGARFSTWKTAVAVGAVASVVLLAALVPWRSRATVTTDGSDLEARSSAPLTRAVVAPESSVSAALGNVTNPTAVSSERVAVESGPLGVKSDAREAPAAESRTHPRLAETRRKAVLAPTAPSEAPASTEPAASAGSPAAVPADAASGALEPRNLYRR